MSAFMADTVRSQTFVRGRLTVQPDDVAAANSSIRSKRSSPFWDVQVREREVPGAVATARTLARDFPENRELRKFLAIHDPKALVIDAEVPSP